VVKPRGEFPEVVVVGDYRRLNQIFMNLVHNAVKFSPIGGIVEIAVQIQGETVEVGVVDRGPGIEKDELDTIFTRYRQGRKCRRRMGSGLGLAIARGLVEAHGGTLRVQSQPGVETIFSVNLPIGNGCQEVL